MINSSQLHEDTTEEIGESFDIPSLKRALHDPELRERICRHYQIRAEHEIAVESSLDDHREHRKMAIFNSW